MTPPRAVTPPQIDAVRLSAPRSVERWRPLVLADLPTSAPDSRSRATLRLTCYREKIVPDRSVLP